MAQYIARRLLLTIPVLWGAATIVFFAIRIVPGDIILAKMQGEFSARPEQLAAARAQLGIDLPAYVQYVHWLGSLARGDLGVSMNTFRPVADNIGRGLPVSMELAVLGLLIGIVIAIPVGVISAVYQDTWLDYSGRLLSISALSIPSFVIGTFIILIPALWWNYSPPLAFVPFWQDPLTNLQIMLPAAVALGAILSGQSMRMTRSMVLEVMRSDYVKTAQAKGLGGVLIMRRHVLRNALIPVVTLWGTSFAQLLGGSVVIELIFSLPGIGRLTLQSIELRDYTQLQGNVLFFALVFVLFNLLVDLLYGVFDPRIRYA